MHRLDDDTLITSALLRRFHAEGEFEGAPGQFYAFVQRSNGDLLTHQVGPNVDGDLMLFASTTLSYINRHLHHDGAWCIVFTHPKPPLPPEMKATFHRFVLLWMDKDGDVQFPLEHDSSIIEALSWSPLDWAKQCETAWTLWHHAMQVVLDPRPDEQFKRAKGQQRPTMH